jgi:superfamily I DNA and RNA helicase
MDKLKELNRKLNEHANASFGNYKYNFKDPYTESLREIRQLDRDRAQKISDRDKRVKRQKRLMPAPKV